MKMVERGAVPGGETSLRGAVDEVFGRWPAWPWSVLGLIGCGGIAGFMLGRMLQATTVANNSALGAVACAGYGIALMAILSAVPRLIRLAMLWPRVSRRPTLIDPSWWPLKLLAAGLEKTPQLRRTHQEFEAAVWTTATSVRSLLADRLWPMWVAAFVVPVLGLITAWQNGSRVQLQVTSVGDIETVFPKLIAETSPPMVAAIGVSLVVMLGLVMIDQCTKALLRRWAEVVDGADGEHPGVVERLGREEFRPTQEPASPRVVAPAESPALPTHPLNPDELKAMWQQATSPDD